MKPFALTLALIATVSAVAQAVPDSGPAATVPVPRIVPAIRNPFAPTAAEIRDIRQQSIERAPASQTEAPPPDSEVLELPKMTVKQQPRARPRLGDHTILGPKAFNDELAKKNLSTLDRGVLNKFTLPAWLGGVSAADRAREEYNIVQKRQFLDDVQTISKAAEATDPANAKALRDAAQKP
jgi:hypothetical protein